MRSPLTPFSLRCALTAILVAGTLACDASAADLSAPPGVPSVGQPRDIPADIVRVARVELRKGVRESPMGSNDSKAIARYRRAMVPRAHSGPWCAYFASWVTRRGGAPIGARGSGIASAAGIRAWAVRTGRWRHLPRPGDIAVFPGHVGVVATVTGSHMTTIDGNWSNRVTQVARRRYEAVGFARVAVGGHRTARRRG
ncbi:MAG: hypothetical protein QOJ57_1124 [Thermoleophilaceae bacterium]|jgi:hypothetical protein|nr:hypothetical protein [Thermoleophilaceae bacterium]